jgi:glycosyltransferase involved in cell wall biosynthesis
VYNPITSILRAAKRQDDEPLNILTFPTHERYETGLCMTGHNFYAYRADGIKDWSTQYGPTPSNYVLLNKHLKDHQVPPYVEFDLVLSQNKFGQFQVAAQLATQMHLPLISLEHTLPMPQWPMGLREQLRNMRGDLNLFISEYSLGEWGWDDRGDTQVIHHMVDTDVFKPIEGCESEFGPGMGCIYTEPRKPHILSVVNDWINRDWCCNYKGWERITKGLPVKVLGDTPGLSKPAGSIAELVREYQESLIFLNTSTISPVPSVLLEAMACGCAVVSTATCMIPEIIEHGVNGFISNSEAELRSCCQILLNDPKLANEFGQAARKTVLEKFSKQKFLSNWNAFFRSVL